MLLQILLGIASLSVLIVGHEWGHYWAARRVGIVVQQFAVFMGPPIWQKKRGPTLYTVGLFPFGGFCKLQSNTVTAGQPLPEGDYFRASLGARILVLLAGPGASLLIGCLLLFVLNTFPQTLPPKTSNRIVVLEQVEGQPGPGFAAGLRSGDRIASVNGQAITSFTDLQSIQKMTLPLDVRYRRQGQNMAAEIWPLNLEQRLIIGLQPWYDLKLYALPATAENLNVGDTIVAINGQPVDNYHRLKKEAAAIPPSEVELTIVSLETETRKIRPDAATVTTLLAEPYRYLLPSRTSGFSSPWAAGWKTLRDTMFSFTIISKGIYALLSKKDALQDGLIGPLRISELIGQSLTLGKGALARWLWIMALISINLALINMIPFPGLDGGNILFSLLIQVVPTRWHHRTYAIYTLVATLLLLVLIVGVFGLDLQHYWQNR